MHQPRSRSRVRLILTPRRSSYATTSKTGQSPHFVRHQDQATRQASQPSTASEEVKPWMVTFTPPKAAASVRFGKIPPSKQTPGLNSTDLPISWRLNSQKKLQDFRRASAAVQRSQIYKFKLRGTNPVGLKGWASLIEERIEAARQQGHFRNLKGSGKPLILSDEERNPFISREEFFMNRIIKKNKAAPPWVELQLGVDASLSSFRRILISTWVRHAVRKLCTRDALSILETQIASFRDRHWEIRENSFQLVALEEVNSAIRNYNHVAPYTVRKSYIDLPSELEKTYQDSQALIKEELASQRAAGVVDLQQKSMDKGDPGSESPIALWTQFRIWISDKWRHVR